MKNTSRFLVCVTFLFFCLLSGHFISTVDSRKNKHKSPSPAESPPADDDNGDSKIINVMSKGAIGDGKQDDTKAFEKAWKAACQVENSGILVPKGFTFLVDYIVFSGDGCEENKVFQLDGDIIAATTEGGTEWLDFTKIKGLIIQGGGVINGMGEAWWKGERATTKPTALRVADCERVSVTGITIQDSQQVHIKFDNCEWVEVSYITISSPGDSPNTDGIHLQGCHHVYIHDNKIACGDDCISIQTGSSGINITRVMCGPSHGISIGSLGKGNSEACVSDVTVTDCFIKNSENGVRIKSWQGGKGSVTRVIFRNIIVDNVDTPAIIDQKYCGGDHDCPEEKGNVAVSSITFDNIKGSFKETGVKLDCGSDVPCKDIALSRIDLHGDGSDYFCKNAFGEEGEEDNPCLQKGGGSSYQHSNYNGDTC